MALATVELERRLPYAPEDLCSLVADVRSYPSFIPWVARLDVLSERQQGDTWIGVARAEIGWHAIVERFTTEVRAGGNAIDVKLISGPFKSLANRWRFAPAPNGGTTIKFYVAYEFRNPILQAVATLNRELVASRIIAAFESEAKRRFVPTA